jgi:hypothetical protein
MFASPVLLLALVPLVGNASSATRKNDTTTRDFAYDLLQSVEPYGIIVTVGDNDTFPLWYAQEVEGIRQDVVVANTSLLNTDWYVRQLIRAPIRPYDSTRGPDIYRGVHWQKPTSPPLKMTLDEADSIPLAVQLPDTQVFEAGKIKTAIAPRVLTKADIAVLRMIKDNPDRPVYFSRTSGRYGEELGLGPWLLTQGLARKLVPDQVVPGRDTVRFPGEGFIDVPRSRDLWLKVFRGPASVVRRNGWPDKASVGIPALYVTTGMLLSDIFRSRGEDSLAVRVARQSEAVARATHIAEFFDFANQPPLPTPGVDSDVRQKTSVPAIRRDSPTKK